MKELHFYMCLLQLIGESVCDHALWLDKGVVRMSGDVETVGNAYMEALT